MGSDRFFFPFFWKDFQLATGNWTDEQVGAYMRLLIYAWDKEGLPLNETAVQEIGKWSGAKWRRIWAVVGAKFEARGGRLVNARQEEIRVAVGGRSTSARLSAEARWTRERADANRHADEMRTHSDGNANKEKQSRSVPPPTPPPAEGRRTRAERKAALRAVGPDDAEWRDRCAAAGHRPACGAPHACKLLIAKAEHPEEIPA